MTHREITCPECGSVFQAPEAKKQRSLEDHRRFFALIRAAYDQWPEMHEFQPMSEEHLRAYLLCKVRYHEVEMIDIGTEIFAGLDMETRRLVDMVVQSAVHRSIEAATRKAGFAFDRPHGSGIAIFRPRSIDWHTLDQAQFNALRDAVETEIEAVIGRKAGELLDESRRAA